MKQILITGHLDDDALNQLRSVSGLTVNYQPKIRRDELMKIIDGFHVLLTRSGTTVDSTLIDQAPSLMIVARAGVGISNIDLEYATQKGILVMNAPGVNTTSAAELTVTLLMSMVRQILQASAAIKQCRWDRHLFCGSELAGKTIGLIGLGNVGRRVAQICQGLQMHVEAYDPYLADEIFDELGVKKRSSLAPHNTDRSSSAATDKDSLVPHCDILSPHVPLNQETKGLVDRHIMQSLKPGAWVVNTSRGGVICEDSLIELLNTGHLAGAAIDTWQNEPTPNAKLATHPKVYGTPHIGAVTVESQRKVGQAIVGQIIKALEGDVVDHPVNIPGLHSGLMAPMKAKMVLCEKLGRLSQQILEFQPSNLTLHFPSSLAPEHQNLLTIAFQKGFLYRLTDEFISYANAATKFAASGMRSSLDISRSSSSQIAITLTNTKEHRLHLKGVVYDDLHPRITHLGEFALEVILDGHFLVFRNQDIPGVVGKVGTFLAQQNINIDSFYLSSHNLQGQALAMVKIHHYLSKSQLEDMKQFSFIDKLFAVDL